MLDKITDQNHEEILHMINKVKWYHKYEILPGVITPGQCPAFPKRLFKRMELPDDLSGLNILEIGSWDGPYSFELESRGANVVAIDIHDPSTTGFNTAKKILNSNVQYIRTSVYDLSDYFDEQFDIVIFAGVFYHLKHPMLAFEQISNVLKTTGTLFFEGECFAHYAENTEGKKIRNYLLLIMLAHSKIPATLFYSDSFQNDKNNWYIPNVECLTEWLKTAGFTKIRICSNLGNTFIGDGRSKFIRKFILSIYHFLFKQGQRVIGSAVKMDGVVKIEHGIIEK